MHNVDNQTPNNTHQKHNYTLELAIHPHVYGTWRHLVPMAFGRTPRVLRRSISPLHLQPASYKFLIGASFELL